MKLILEYWGRRGRRLQALLYGNVWGSCCRGWSWPERTGKPELGVWGHLLQPSQIRETRTWSLFPRRASAILKFFSPPTFQFMALLPSGLCSWGLLCQGWPQPLPHLLRSDLSGIRLEGVRSRSPQTVPLWHVGSFELKATETLWNQEKHLSLP